MCAFGCDKSIKIIYKNLLFNEFQGIQDDCRSFAIMLATK